MRDSNLNSWNERDLASTISSSRVLLMIEVIQHWDNDEAVPRFMVQARPWDDDLTGRIPSPADANVSAPVSVTPITSAGVERRGKKTKSFRRKLIRRFIVARRRKEARSEVGSVAGEGRVLGSFHESRISSMDLELMVSYLIDDTPFKRLDLRSEARKPGSGSVTFTDHDSKVRWLIDEDEVWI